MGCKVKTCTHALDKSLRSIDQDGHMVVEMSRISKANVCPYRGDEIPNSEELGLDPNKIYRLYRDPAEFANGTMMVDGEEVRTGAWSADGKPLVIKHNPITAEVPKKELWVGTVGACTFEPPYLVTRPLTVITSEAQALIEAEEQRELSAGYRYRADMTPGKTPEGEPYDGRMVELRFNHVAIVREGRVGSDVHVADEFPPELRSMKHRTKIARLQKAIPALANLSTADLMALDAELGETPAKTAVSLTEDEKRRACDAARDAKRMAHGEDAELTEEEREEAIRKATDKKARDAKKSAKDKAARDALKGHRAANDAESEEERREKEEESDEQEAAADAEEEAEDEREEAEDAEEDDEEARDRRKARDERRRARDRKMGARDARKAARDRARAEDGKPARDAEIDHRDDFNSNRQGGANKSGRDSRRRAHDSMTMDQVQRAIKRAQDETAERVREEVTAKQRALAIACDEVTPLVGKVQLHAFDSADEVYAFTAEKIGLEDYEDLNGAALRVLIKNELRHRGQLGKKSPKHALDRSNGGFDADSLFQRVN